MLGILGWIGIVLFIIGLCGANGKDRDGYDYHDG